MLNPDYISDMLTAAVRECEHLDDLFFQLRNERSLPPPFPKPSDLGRVFRQLSLLKSLFRPAQPKSMLAKKNRNLAICVYLAAFTPMESNFFKNKEPISVDIESLAKYASKIKEYTEEKGINKWSEFISKKAGAKAEILAAFYAFSAENETDSSQDSSLSVDTHRPRRLRDPAQEFEASVLRAREQASKS